MIQKAFIWDLDGTLLDSYDIIVRSLYLTYKEYGLETDMEEIHKHVLQYSVSSFLHTMESKTGKSFEEMKETYSRISGALKNDIRAMDGAKELLEYLNLAGIPSFVFTHRGATTQAVLTNLGIFSLFQEIITSQSGFARKPAPDAIHYFLEKYQLDPANTYYVGDRLIDMESARNAGIKGIFLADPKGYADSGKLETLKIRHLMEIKEYLYMEEIQSIMDQMDKKTFHADTGLEWEGSIQNAPK